MSVTPVLDKASPNTDSFFARPGIHVERVPATPSVPFGYETVYAPAVGIGGAYGTWGQYFDNEHLPELVAEQVGAPLADDKRLNLAELGFLCRHHVPQLTPEQHLNVEMVVAERLLREAAAANGWETGEVDAVLLGSTSPVVPDFTERVATAAGIPESALKVSIHKACDGSVAALNLALNPDLPSRFGLPVNVAERLRGKKVLLGGFEGLSRLMRTQNAGDLQALQLFGNGAGVVGVVPGQTVKFLVGGTHEVYDEEGLLQVQMSYPHAQRRSDGETNVEVTVLSPHHIRLAGLMHEPTNAEPVVMAGPMGMVKLFVRSGVVAVRGVYGAYRTRMAEVGTPSKDIAVAVVHHANLKINQLKERYLQKEGISFPMPWLLSDFGNVSAASNMIAFLRALGNLKAGDHVLFDGFGAGTYYDVLAVEVG